jgi:hypothetical protein
MWDTDSRVNFSSSFLSEMPEGIGSTELSDKIESFIANFKQSGQYPVINLANGLNKIEGQQTVFYWFEKNGEFQLGAELEKTPYALVVRTVGKKIKGQPPYASDLYAAIVNDRSGTIRLMSDSQLSDEGLSLWKRMLTLGYKVGVYDKENPGKSFTLLKTDSELDSFFKNDDRNYRRYQYVISEQSHSVEINHLFEVRRLRELIPTTL